MHVPYQGSPQAVSDLIAGRTTTMFSPASTVIGQIAAGKLTALASAANKRPSILPDCADHGILKTKRARYDDGIFWSPLIAPEPVEWRSKFHSKHLWDTFFGIFMRKFFFEFFDPPEPPPPPPPPRPRTAFEQKRRFLPQKTTKFDKINAFKSKT